MRGPAAFSAIRHDPIFGEVTFHRSLGLVGAGFWDGRVRFAPTGSVIGIRVTAGRLGIIKEQRELFRAIESRYLDLTASIQNILLSMPLRYWGSEFFEKVVPKPEWKDFELSSIGIARPERDVFRWNLSFRYLPMHNSYSVNFENWDLICGEIDD